MRSTLRSPGGRSFDYAPGNGLGSTYWRASDPGGRNVTRGQSFKERIRYAELTVAIGVVAAGGGAASTALALATRSGAPRRPAYAQGLDVLPFPGTPDAAPGTNVDFPAVPPAQVRSVTVVGSRSGLHAGRLSAQPAGHGTAFSPDRPFAPGEHVSVTATFSSATAGNASGAPGAKRIRFSFSVAQPGSVADIEGPGTRADRHRAASIPAAHVRPHDRANLHPSDREHERHGHRYRRR